MLNSILETRRVKRNLTNITLSISEHEYFTFYDSLSEVEANNIMNNYLKYRADDGRPERIKIRHNKNEHIVTIDANLSYIGNERV